MDNTEQKPLPELAEKFYEDNIQPRQLLHPRPVIELMTDFASQQTEQLTSYFEKVLATKVRILEDNHKEQTEQLQADNKWLNDELDIYGRKITELESEKEALQANTEADKIYIDTLHGRIGDLQAEVERLKIEASKYAFECDRAKEDRNKAERRNTQLEEALREIADYNNNSQLSSWPYTVSQLQSIAAKALNGK
jgi:chromosome segregation ATPase